MRNFYKTALFAVLMGAGSAAAAEDGTITFTGTISDATCEITGGDAGGDAGSPDFTVKLPSISTTALSKADMRAGDTPFYIKLSGANCTNGKVASVYFEQAQSTNIDTTTGNLKNTTPSTSGGAKNVQIGLLDSDKAVMNLTTANNNAKTVTVSGNTARFDYWAQYVAVGGAATAGDVASDVVYSIQYK